jgi:hypothetical protein
VVTSEIGTSVLLPVFIQLLTDKEAEVRAVIAGKLFAFTNKLTPANQKQLILTHIIPTIEVCSCDTSCVWRMPRSVMNFRLHATFATPNIDDCPLKIRMNV